MAALAFVDPHAATGYSPSVSGFVVEGAWPEMEAVANDMSAAHTASFLPLIPGL